MEQSLEEYIEDSIRDFGLTKVQDKAFRAIVNASCFDSFQEMKEQCEGMALLAILNEPNKLIILANAMSTGMETERAVMLDIQELSLKEDMDVEFSPEEWVLLTDEALEGIRLEYPGQFPQIVAGRLYQIDKVFLKSVVTEDNEFEDKYVIKDLDGLTFLKEHLLKA